MHMHGDMSRLEEIQVACIRGYMDVVHCNQFRTNQIVIFIA